LNDCGDIQRIHSAEQIWYRYWDWDEQLNTDGRRTVCTSLQSELKILGVEMVGALNDENKSSTENRRNTVVCISLKHTKTELRLLRFQDCDVSAIVWYIHLLMLICYLFYLTSVWLLAGPLVFMFNSSWISIEYRFSVFSFILKNVFSCFLLPSLKNHCHLSFKNVIWSQ
jgi:hypothetical protein